MFAPFVLALMTVVFTAYAQIEPSLIEHTNLKADATEADINKLCNEAKHYQFRGVCVHERHIFTARKYLGRSPVKVITVVGFPHAGSSTETLVKVTENAIRLGADEVDMVISVGELKEAVKVGLDNLLEADSELRRVSSVDRQWVSILKTEHYMRRFSNNNLKFQKVFYEIQSVVKAAGDKPVKVIIETGLLTDIEKIVACLLSMRAGAAYVKTSTGTLENKGATVQDVELMRLVVGNKMGIKAAGGIRDAQFAKALIEAGANVIGTSSSIQIVQPQSKL